MSVSGSEITVGIRVAVTQEQLAVMLWRDAGSYVLGDEYKTEGGAWADASEWAKMGVLWCEVEKLTNENGAPFEPKAPATRAQVADTVYRCILLKESFANTDAVSAATKTADSLRPTQWARTFTG